MPPTEPSTAERDWADSQQSRSSKSQSQSQQRQQTQSQTHNSQVPTQAQAQAQAQAQEQQQQQHHQPPFSSRVSQQRLAKQKSHVAGRLHTRSSSSKGTHNNKYHGQSNAASSSAAVRPQNRRTQSEQRLTHSSNNTAANNSSTNVTTALKKTASQTAIARNRSDLAGPASRRHVSSKTSLAGDRPKRSGSGANVAVTAAATASTAQRSTKTHKTQVFFDVGTADNDDDNNEAATEDDDSEWQDASTSASPYITKHTPSAAKSSTQKPTRTDSQPEMSVPTTASSATMVSSTDASSDMTTSRFIGTQTSTLASEGSFYTTTQGSTDTTISADHMRRIAAAATTTKRNGARTSSQLAPTSTAALTDDEDAAGIASTSALGSTASIGGLSSRAMPHRIKPAEKSRTQQKLDLQRASSGMDTVALPNPVHAGLAAANSQSIVSVMQPGLDGAATRDPRITKLLEQTGAAYMVMRRYQNPIARSVDRLAMGSGPDKLGPLLRKGAGIGTSPVGSATPGAAGAMGAPDSMARYAAASRRASTASRPSTMRSMQTPDNGFDEQRAAPMLSAPAPDEEEISVILQNLWDRTVDYGVSQ